MKQFKTLMAILLLILVILTTWLGCAPPVGTPEPVIIDEYTVLYFDSALYQEIRAQVTDPDNIKLSDLAQIKTLNLSNKEVQYLTNIEYLPNLENLNLDYNPIKDLSPLKGLKNLKVLSISETDITNFSALSSLTALNELYITDNPVVTDLGKTLAGLTNLHTLSLRNNPSLYPYADSSMGTTQDLVLPSSLTLLDLSGDIAISDLHFLVDRTNPANPIYLENLTELNASNTSVDNVSAVGWMGKLSKLNISNCYVLNLSPLFSSGVGQNGGEVIITGNNPAYGREGASLTPEECTSRYNAQIAAFANFPKITLTN